MLCKSLLYSKVTQLYTHTHSFLNFLTCGSLFTVLVKESFWQLPVVFSENDSPCRWICVVFLQGADLSVLLFPHLHLLLAMYLNLCMCACAQSCLTICDPMDSSPPGSSVHGIFQARILEGVAILQRTFLTQGSNLHLLCLLHWQAGSLPLVLPGKPGTE